MHARSLRTPYHAGGRTPDALSRCGPEDLARAWGSRDLLLHHARLLVATLDHDPDLADCAAAGCATVGRADAGRCALVHRLASLEVDRLAEGRGRAAPGFEAATRGFELALTGAVDAVRRCRQIEHGTGRCWFAAVPGVDGCGEVLRAAHRLG
jgi:hypothetical protein